MRRTLPVAFIFVAFLFLFVSSSYCQNRAETLSRDFYLGGSKQPAAPAFIDSDNDGVPDNLDNRYSFKILQYYDRCQGTLIGVAVDKNGCPLDSDRDGVPDYLDMCPDTPMEVKVDDAGCPLDSDRDGVPDYLDKCPDTPIEAKVDDAGCPLDSDKDGVPDYLDKCPDTPMEAKVDNAGCPLDSDKDGVFDYLDMCPDTPAGVKVDQDGCAPTARFVLLPELDGTVGQIEVTTSVGSQRLDKPWESTEVVSPDRIPSKPEVMDEKEVKETFKEALEALPSLPDSFVIYFQLGSTELTHNSLQLIPEIVETIKSKKSSHVIVIGHTDTVASLEYNRRLSRLRAKSVADLLVSKGVDRTIIENEFYGKERLLIETPDGVAEPMNRRVEILVK